MQVQGRLQQQFEKLEFVLKRQNINHHYSTLWLINSYQTTACRSHIKTGLTAISANLSTCHNLRGRRSYPKAHEGNETVNACEKINSSGGVGRPSYFSSVVSSPPPHISPFVLTPGALVCSLAYSISPTGKWKGNGSGH